MATVLYVASNPKDGLTTYQKIRIERAPDSSGSPGAFSLVAIIDIDSFNESTDYTDTGATATTDWYRHRWQTTDGATKVSDWSAFLQAGDSIVRQWIRADVTDADLTLTMFDRWRDQAFSELQSKQLGRIVTQTVTPAADANDAFINLNSDLRIVYRVDMYDGGNYAGWTDQWEQVDRQVRLFYPSASTTYKFYAIGELRDYGDIDDELFMLVYWMIRKSYLDYRVAQRAHWKLFQVSERPDDTSTGALIQLRELAHREVDQRLADARRIIPIPARGH